MSFGRRRLRLLRLTCDCDGNDLVLLHHGESVAGLHLEGIILEADDGAVNLRAVLEFDLVGAR